MTIKRMDHVSIIVDDLPAAVAFFTALGMATEGQMPVEGAWVDRLNGLEGVRGHFRELLAEPLHHPGHGLSFTASVAAHISAGGPAHDVLHAPLIWFSRSSHQR